MKIPNEILAVWLYNGGAQVTIPCAIPAMIFLGLCTKYLYRVSASGN